MPIAAELVGADLGDDSAAVPPPLFPTSRAAGVTTAYAAPVAARDVRGRTHGLAVVSDTSSRATSHAATPNAAAPNAAAPRGLFARNLRVEEDEVVRTRHTYTCIARRGG